jgi:hypothetical protein
MTYVPSLPDWSELAKPAQLEPGDTPLFRGELGTLDCGYTFKPTRPPVLVGVDMGSGRDVGVTGRWVGDKLEVIEHVRTGPGTPFARVEWPIEHGGQPRAPGRGGPQEPADTLRSCTTSASRAR